MASSPANNSPRLHRGPRRKPSRLRRLRNSSRPTEPCKCSAILQRDSRLIDFLMEDISPYSDDQVGAAVRNLHDQCRDTLDRYVHLAPVIDGVEGTFTKVDSSDPPRGQTARQCARERQSSGRRPAS